jgi:hypothetical protein
MAGEHSADEGMEEAPARQPFPTFVAARHRRRPDSPLFDIGACSHASYCFLFGFVDIERSYLILCAVNERSPA